MKTQELKKENSNFIKNLDLVLESETVHFLDYARGCLDGILQTRIVFQVDQDLDYERYILYSLAIISRAKELGFEYTGVKL